MPRFVERIAVPKPPRTFGISVLFAYTRRPGLEILLIPCLLYTSHAQTKPLIDYYGDQGILKTVDGTLPMETVFDEIVKMIEA